jgi:hypothetical protein
MSRNRHLWLVLALPVLAAGSVAAHTYVGLEHRTLVRARVQSPNASAVDRPVPIPDTNLSVACFRIRNSGQFDSRITAIGLALPPDALGQPQTGFALVSPLNAGFHLIEQVTQVPGLRNTTLAFALVTGKTFAGGDPHAGLAFHATELTQFCVSGPFPRREVADTPGEYELVPIEQLLNSGVLRVQQVGADGELGDVAVWENLVQ